MLSFFPNKASLSSPSVDYCCHHYKSVYRIFSKGFHKHKQQQGLKNIYERVYNTSKFSIPSIFTRKSTTTVTGAGTGTSVLSKIKITGRYRTLSYLNLHNTEHDSRSFNEKIQKQKPIQLQICRCFCNESIYNHSFAGRQRQKSGDEHFHSNSHSHLKQMKQHQQEQYQEIRRRFHSSPLPHLAGHNKWSKIRHAKGKNDAQRGLLFSKISIEISAASRACGGDMSNIRLQAAISKAKSSNMPKDNIENAIKKGTSKVS